MVRASSTKLAVAASICLSLAGCYTTPERPAEVSTAFDGVWAGVASSGGRCPRVTEVEGRIVDGLARFFLSHNGRDISGWMRPDGSITLRNHGHQSSLWSFWKFEGQASGARIEGPVWVREYCEGPWYVERQAGGIAPMIRWNRRGCWLGGRGGGT